MTMEMTSPRVPRALVVPSTPGRLLWLAALDWGAIAVCGVAMHLTPFWLFPLWAALIGGRLHGLATLAHDAAHLGKVRRTPALTLLDVVAAYPVATSIRALRAHHLRHHRDTNLASDPYCRARGPSGRLAGALAWGMASLLYAHWVLRALVGAAAFFLPALRPRYRALLLMRADLPCEESELDACLRAELPLAAFLLCIGVVTGLWPRVLTAHYFAPIAFAFAFNATRLLAEHTRALVADRSVESMVSATRDTGWSAWARLFLTPHNLGFHVMHHLHPDAGLGALPRIDAWYRAHRPELFEGRAPQHPR